MREIKAQRRGFPETLRAIKAALLALLALPLLAAAQPGGLEQVSGFGQNEGKLLMFKYVPPNLEPSRPLVVALHGCTQKAADYDDETGWVMLADRLRFALLLPEQQQANNDRRCFNWFLPGHNERDRGEARSIKEMVDKMKADHGSHPERVFVTGLSGGGAMAAVMLAAYPVRRRRHHCGHTLRVRKHLGRGLDPMRRVWRRHARSHAAAMGRPGARSIASSRPFSAHIDLARL